MASTADTASTATNYDVAEHTIMSADLSCKWKRWGRFFTVSFFMVRGVGNARETVAPLEKGNGKETLNCLRSVDGKR